MKPIFQLFACLTLFVPGICWAQAKEFAWEKAIAPRQAGTFSEVPPLQASYEFGWTNIPAARAKVIFYYSGDRYSFSASGGTYGLARRLWQIDATQTSSGFRGTWLPEKMHQVERYRDYALITDVRYNKSQADRLRMRIPTSGKIPGRKVFAIENMRDMLAALLFVRSQPLRNGDKISQVVFPGDAPFFVQCRVLGREIINVSGKPTPAIKFSLNMKKIMLNGPQAGSLVPHRKFHSGTVWITDDAQRIPIRAAMDVFIGYVYAQLQSVQLE